MANGEIYENFRTSIFEASTNSFGIAPSDFVLFRTLWIAINIETAITVCDNGRLHL